MSPRVLLFLHSLQMRVLLENTTYLLHKIVRIAGVIRVAVIIRGRALYEEIRYLGMSNIFLEKISGSVLQKTPSF